MFKHPLAVDLIKKCLFLLLLLFYFLFFIFLVEICLDGDQWNDGLLATIRERV